MGKSFGLFSPAPHGHHEDGREGEEDEEVSEELDGPGAVTGERGRGHYVALLLV